NHANSPIDGARDASRFLCQQPVQPPQNLRLLGVRVVGQLALDVLAHRFRKSLPWTRAFARHERRAQRPGLGPVAGVGPRQHLLRLLQDLLQTVHAGGVRYMQIDQVGRRVRVALPHLRQIDRGCTYVYFIYPSGFEGKELRRTFKSFWTKLKENHTLVVRALAEVHALDRPRVADMFAAAERLGLVDVTQRDVRELGRQALGGNDHVVLFRQTEERRADGRPVNVDVSRQHRWTRSIEPLVPLDGTQRVEERGHQLLVLLFRAGVLLPGLVAKIPARSRVRHQNELDVKRLPSIAKAQEGWRGGQVEPPRGDQVAYSPRRWGREVHGVGQSAAEVLVVVIAGESEDGPAGREEVTEDMLPVLDALAQPVRAGQLAEQVPGHEQHIDLFLTAVCADALDGSAPVRGAAHPPH